MKRLSGFSHSIAAALALLPLSAGASVADSYPVPPSDANGFRGATVPYTRYDCNTPADAVLASGAAIKSSPDWDAAEKATQASDQAYVDMPVGSSVTWTMRTYGDGVTVRYTIADKNVGGTGKTDGWKSSEGRLEIYVNGALDQTIDLTSYFMYQYFSKGSGSPSQSSGDAPNFCFDEKHVKLSRMAKPGDTITVKCISGDEVGVDFIETEVVPAPIDPAEEAAGRKIFNVTDYGASTSSRNNVAAFNNALKAANAVGGIVYIPEGTWLLGEMWSIAGKNVKITGAGIWHTNLQFTGYGQFGGGISGGNCKNGPFMSSQNDNMEVCHMYINSNLADRHGENAVYKCFMDIWCGGSVIHDIWEEHFECGFWFGDYNSPQRRCSDGVRVVSCRIRNNYADGVNFCQGTSDAAVFNCSVRNNGDDGLACWNNTEQVKDETGNTFAYNTIDFIWRAGGVAIYGGKDQKVYNNYICDMFMASGVHMNTTFPGPGFATTSKDEPVLIENNYLVRCGTPWECWGRDYAVFDLEGEVKHVVFRNNYVYESPAEIVRITDGPSYITFDGLYCNGAGLSRQAVNYNAVAHSVGAGNLNIKGSGITWKNFLITKGSVPAATVGANMNQYSTWPFWNQAPTSWSWTEEEYETPPYPDSEGIVPVPDPFETLTDYDVVLTGIDWLTNQEKHSMYDEDKVSFKVRIDNRGKNDIPEGAKFNVALSIDNGAGSSFTVKDGLKAGAHMIIEFPMTWTATKGMHTFTATVDPAGKMLHETDRTNNTRVKSVNVNEIPEGEEPGIEITTHQGPDMGVVKVWFENLSGDQDEINVGDRLLPHAIVANYGSTTITLGSGQGFLWGLDGIAEYNSGMLWNDETNSVAPGQWIDIVPNGGGNLSTAGWNSDFTITAKAGTIELFGRMDNPDKYSDNNSDNNSGTATYDLPKTRPVYNPDPDKADNLITGGHYDYEDGEQGGDDPVTGFDLIPTGIFWTPGSSEIQAGNEITGFRVRISNNSSVSLPEGKAIRLTLSVDGKTLGSVRSDNGLEAGGFIDLNINGSLTATAGGHTVDAVVTSVAGELDSSNNSRQRSFNAIGDIEAEPARIAINPEAETSTLPFVIEKVEWFNANPTARATDSPIRPGDKVRFSATIRNNSNTASAPVKHGIEWQFTPGNTGNIIWNDKHYSSVQPGERITLTSTGGNVNTDGTWTATEGTSTIRAWFNDDQHALGNWDSQFDFPVEIVSSPRSVEYIANPTGDDSETTGIADSVTADEPTEDTWYNMHGIRIDRPTAPGIYIRNGHKIIIR